MKKIILGAFAFAAFSCAFAFDSSSLSPKGKVNEYTKTEYTVTTKFGDYYRAPRVAYVHTINADGQETESVELTNKGILVDKISFEYNGKGLCVARVCTDAEGNTSWKTTMSYDDKGNKTEESEYNAHGALTSKTITKYNLTAKTIDESVYDAEGSLLVKYISKLDEAGKLVEINAYSTEGFLEERETFSYNDLGNLVEKSIFNGAGSQKSRIIYKYDPATILLSEVQLFNDANKLSQRTIYKYDNKENLTRETVYQVSEKFGATVNELVGISEFTYRTDGKSSLSAIVEKTASAIAPSASEPAAPAPVPATTSNTVTAVDAK